jgi:muramoyltetrapeptide carboxypeptidase
MRRKQFLSSLSKASILLAVKPSGLVEPTKNDWKIPAFLKKGDTIGITSPGGTISLEGIQPAVKKLQDWGYNVAIGNSIGQQDHTFGGTDLQRTDDMQSMLDDKNIKAILCARGGYGSVRIIDQLNFSNFRKNPKWIIGFSDVTVFINHIFEQQHCASIHSKMCNSFPSVWENADALQKQTIESINDCLQGKMISYTTAANENNKIGSGEGRLIGGNLRTLENLAGTKSSPSTKGCILFIEDTGEYLYSIDRMLRNLLRSGKLTKLKGLIVGGFKIKAEDDGEPFGQTLEEIILNITKDFDYPICFDFPVGHQKNNMALTCGVKSSLVVTKQEATLKINPASRFG